MRIAHHVRPAAVTLAALSLMISVNTSAVAGGSPSSVTSGEVGAMADSGIQGHAQMVRRANGTTFVMLKLTGLTPGVTYRSHVHTGACAGGGGVHYQFIPGGSTMPPNEIHPGDGPFMANPAGNANVNTTADDVAGESAISVVVHNADAANQKVACADLA